MAGIQWRDPLQAYNTQGLAPGPPVENQVPPRREWIKGDFRRPLPWGQDRIPNTPDDWNEPKPTWPRALRITIEMYDQRGTLRPVKSDLHAAGGLDLPPIRHVIMHTWP